MHDSDPFNRWQAAQTYATNLLTAAARDGADRSCAGARTPRVSPQALGATARDAALLPAYRAEFLKLPSESDIARELGRDVDTDAVHRARETLRARRSATRSRETLAELYESSRRAGPIRRIPQSAGLRALRSAALDLLVATGEAVRDRARRTALPRGVQHDRRHRGALHPVAARGSRRATPRSTISTRAGRTSRSCSTNGSRCRRGRRGANSVETVRALLSHPKFSLKNPNRIRALIGSFVHANPDRLQPRRRRRLPAPRRAGARDRRFQPARGGAAARRLRELAHPRARSARPAPRRCSRLSRPSRCPPTATRSSQRPLAPA